MIPLFVFSFILALVSTASIHRNGVKVSAPTVPEWPLNFSISLPPFLEVKYSSGQQYEVFINTDSPKSWQSVGVSGRILFDCVSVCLTVDCSLVSPQKVRSTIYDPFATTLTGWRPDSFNQWYAGLIR